MDFVFQTASGLSEYGGEILRLLYKKYADEMKRLPCLKYMSKDRFQAYIGQRFPHTKAVVGMEGGLVVGVLLYRSWEQRGEKHIDIPVYGYGARPEQEARIIGRLFQYMARQEAVPGITDFSVHLYAHDMSIQQLFSFMQFGTMAETCIRKASAIHERSTHYRIQNLSKKEIKENWAPIWSLTGNVIAHLKESPIFYKGTEFTEEGYRAFYMDESTTLFAAYNDSGEMIGIIESNRDENAFVCPDDSSVNVGEVYVLPEYRRSGLSQDLLYYAESFVAEQGAAYMWVEHGTANPNARGFWNKYFDTYQYEMVRQVIL